MLVCLVTELGVVARAPKRHASTKGDDTTEPAP
jgi:hypothetical protein